MLVAMFNFFKPFIDHVAELSDLFFWILYEVEVVGCGRAVVDQGNARLGWTDLELLYQIYNRLPHGIKPISVDASRAVQNDR